MDAEQAGSQTVNTSTLIKAILMAFVLAGLLLITVILPAEYGIDPTGAGKRLGLTALVQPASPTETSSVIESAPSESVDGAASSHQVSITVPANGGIEYKFQLSQHAKLQYEWTSGGPLLYLDLHGEPEGDTTGFFESYVEATANGMTGTLTVPFDGSHGWYWENSSETDVVVELTVNGDFELIGYP